LHQNQLKYGSNEGLTTNTIQFKAVVKPKIVQEHLYHH